MPGDPGKGGWGLGRIAPPPPRPGARGRWGWGGRPGEEAEAQALRVGVPERGPAYLGFVEQEPHEGGEQQGGGERGARPQLLGEGGKGGGRGLLGQGHGVRGAHAGGRAAGSVPRLTLAKGARGRTARCHGPDAEAGEAATGHRPRRPAVTAPAGRPRAPPPQPPRRAPPTAPAPGSRAPADWQSSRRLGSHDVSAGGGARAPAPPLAPARGPERGRSPARPRASRSSAPHPGCPLPDDPAGPAAAETRRHREGQDGRSEPRAGLGVGTQEDPHRTVSARVSSPCPPPPAPPGRLQFLTSGGCRAFGAPRESSVLSSGGQMHLRTNFCTSFRGTQALLEPDTHTAREGR